MNSNLADKRTSLRKPLRGFVVCQNPEFTRDGLSLFGRPSGTLFNPRDLLTHLLTKLLTRSQFVSECAGLWTARGRKNLRNFAAEREGFEPSIPLNRV